MALIKQEFSIDLTKGTNTKTNDQITDDFKDMQNVVFTGDLTVKKMPGYDLISTVPNITDSSLVFKRGNDLLVQTSSGTYKYFVNSNQFALISNIGSGELINTDSYGHIIAVGTNYNAYLKTVNFGEYGFSTSHISNIFTFTDKNGTVINSITFGAGFASAPEHYWEKWSKALAVGNDFYFFHVTSDGSNANALQLSKFTFSAGTFSLADSYPFFSPNLVLTYHAGTNALLAFDMIYDGTAIYMAYSSSLENRFLKFPTSGSLVPSVNSVIAETISYGLELRDFNGTTILMGASIEAAGTSTFYQRSYSKTTLSFVSQATIASTTLTFGGGLNVNIAWSFYPTSQTTCIYYFTAISATGQSVGIYYDTIKKGLSIGQSGQPVEGLIPVGKIFTYNSKYYAFMMHCLGERRAFALVDVQTMTPRAIFGRESLLVDSSRFGANKLLSNRKLISSYSSYVAPNPVYLFPGHYSIQEQYFDQGYYLFGNFNDSDIMKVGKFSFSTISNQSIEVSGKNIVSGSIPSYYDGTNFVEHDLIGEPYLVLRANTPGSLLPAGNYQVVACYVWKDSSGTVFRSGLSNVLGGTLSDQPINLPANNFINIDIYFPILTTRLNVECHIYIRSGTSNFQLFAIIPVGISSPTTSKLSISIDAYPNQSAETLYTQQIGSAATQTEDLPSMSMKAMALYADRIFYIKNGDNNAIYFSKKKVTTEDFSFDETLLVLHAFDKRGFNEDQLIGLQAMDGRLFIFKNNSILYTVGDGPGDNGTNSDLVSPQLVTTDVGCTSNRSIILTPVGIMFKSDKGIYLLDRKLQVSYIGAPVERFNSEIITSAVILENKNEIRWTTVSGIVLVYSYYSQQWSWFVNMPSFGALMLNGKYIFINYSGQFLQENPTHNKMNGAAIQQKISSPWLRGPGGKQSWDKVYDLLILGKYKTPHQIQISFYFDYELYADSVYTLNPLTSTQYNIASRPTNGQTETGASTDGVYQYLIDIPRKNCQSFRFEIVDIPTDLTGTGESFALSSFEITYGVKKGPGKLVAAKTY